MNTISRCAFSFALSLLALLGACSRPAPRLPAPPERTESWSREFVEAFASLPLQDNGRVKPAVTFAAFALYQIHGRRDLQYTVPGADGRDQKVTLDPTEWLCDIWCYPNQASIYPLFRIEHSGVLDALGFANDGQKQGFEYLSYAQLLEEKVLQKLQELFRQYSKVDQTARNDVQEHLVQLWRRFVAYDAIHRQLASLQYDIDVTGDELQQAVGGATVRLATVLGNAGPLRALLLRIGRDIESEKHANVMRLVEFLTSAVENDNGGARLLPPIAALGEQDTWHTLGDGINMLLQGQGDALLPLFRDLQQAMQAKGLRDKETALRAFRDKVAALAGARTDAGHIALETTYYRANWHYQSIHWFLFGFVLAAACWLLPRNRLLWWASLLVTTAALGMLSYDIVLRCLITGRPPIKNLYDTFLFIAAVGVAISLVAELVLPRRLALAIAPVLGSVLVMFGRMFEVTRGEDTMDPLVAVLDSNFWLATHVTTINIGYATGLAAAVFACVWVLLRASRLVHPADPTAKALMRMIYGITCFSLAFGVVGTILGGVWANDSWGRFWGWDPKENGALMICLAQIALLHARMSGMVRDTGIALWATVTGCVVVFSWFHVNLLGVGLHSYGFSSGLRDAVWWSYTIGLSIFCIGCLDNLLRPVPVRQGQAADAAVPARAGAANAAWPTSNG